ncbi:MAG: choice-of-anchor D domain-containing protein [Gemmatimonadota bacterium]|nr:MAG: choice-of-anchor D domain-containing protein [Gemmatimonadota bacterium]
MGTFMKEQHRRFTGEIRPVACLMVLFVLLVVMSGSVPAQEILLDPTSIDFGEVTVGETAQRTLTISNEGTEDLIVSEMALDNRAFAVEPTTVTVSGGSSSNVTVSFTPGSEGVITGTLTVTSNDPVQPTVEVPLNGSGAGGIDMEATVSVENGYGDPGTTHNKVVITMNNSVGLAGMNFVLNFDADILDPTEVVPGIRAADMSIFEANLEYGTGQVILVIADREGDTIAPGSGPVAIFYIDVSSEALLGEYALTLTDVVLANFEGQEIPTDVVDGMFVVTGPSGDAWSVTVTATPNDVEEPTVDLIFGVDPDGTDDFDPDLDEPKAPTPPGVDFEAYFSIDAVLNRLTKDVRSSTVLTVIWTLETKGVAGTFTWDTAALPPDADIMFDGVDMGESNSMEFEAGQSYTITYSYEDQTPPADVTGLQGLAGDGKVTLMWTASTSEDVRGYKVYVDSAGVPVDEFDVGDVSYYEVIGLANLCIYTLTVTAYDEVGNESGGVSVDVEPNAGSYAILLTLGSSAHDDTVRAFFGADPSGTEGLDVGLDSPCPPHPPLPPDLFAYFPLDHPVFKQLCTDIRSSLDSMVVWTLVTEGTEGEICWNPNDFPNGQFVLNDEINMRDVTCAQFEADDTLTITYTVWVAVEPHPELPMPEEYVLVQNYPNPFNPETTIEYRLPQVHEVSLEVFNVLGQHIRTLVNVKQEAGTYTVTWDGLDKDGLSVASGVYFYRLQAGEFFDTKSMLLLK